MNTKAAVVIGVDKTGGGYEPLEGAAAGAVEVAEWLETESYDVELLTDLDGPLHASAVRDALKMYVTEPPRYELLVVYFSGHGIWHARSDRWLFSDAPTDTSDAINLQGAMTLAKYSGIDTVVFVSDACRSLPDRAAGAEVTGIDAFPNLDFDMPNKVDSIKATSRARDAYEATIPADLGGVGTRQSVLTAAWRSAYDNPPDHLVREVAVDGRSIEVVPNRRLEDYLQPKVDELLAAVDLSLVQNLDIVVPSPDDVFVARAHRRVDPAPPEPRRGRRRSLGPAALWTGVGPEASAAMRGIDDVPSEVDRRIPNLDVRSSYETECGFVITGAAVGDVACTTGEYGAAAEVEQANSPAQIRLSGVGPAVSTAIQFADGRSTLLPAFQGYIGHVAVDDGGIIAVSYVPSANTELFRRYRMVGDELDQRRALVAMAINDNRFVIGDDDEARAMADQIRIDKALDPSLGLYAAVAYSEAGRDDQVGSILSIMYDDLGVSIFDVALLASRQATPEPGSMVPHVPVLTQNWSQLRPRQVEIPDVLSALRPALLDSLWTTFDSGAGAVLVDAVRDGLLT
ncbi:MAG: caspase family protein [Actinomycetota bacterium]